MRNRLNQKRRVGTSNATTRPNNFIRAGTSNATTRPNNFVRAPLVSRNEARSISDNPLTMDN